MNTSAQTTLTTEDFQQVRDVTEKLAAPLSPEDQQIQSMPDVSPTKWHRAHVTWFFETFLLKPKLADYTPFDEDFEFLFNSYYEGVGDRHARDQRGLISRPSAAQITEYRRHVDEGMHRLIAQADDETSELIVLGLHHEQQHQELLLMDIKHVLASNPTHPRYHSLDEALDITEVAALKWHGLDGGLVEIGHEGEGFHYDNEGPRHRVFLEPFQISDRLVTNGEWLDFMADDGYHDHRHWLSAGWGTVNTQGWEAPLYWEPTASGWQMQTLHGFEPVEPTEPVTHVSFFEADAFARWAGARLPTECEWEHAATTLNPDATSNLTTGRFHPRRADAGDGLRQLFGGVWQWTSSSYSAYPGFRTAAGAVGEYNGKFMADQYVLRGSCTATPLGHARTTYRNFFPSDSRWMFSGLRLANDA